MFRSRSASSIESVIWINENDLAATEASEGGIGPTLPVHRLTFHDQGIRIEDSSWQNAILSDGK